MIRKGVRKVVKWTLSSALKKKYAEFSSKDRELKFMGMNLLVKAGIFHPSFFFSTKVLIQYLETQDIDEKVLLELGCGSGAISVWAAKNGAFVTASDINQKAVDNTFENATKNHVSVNCIQSNLFENLDVNGFDYIIINPPYYPKNPGNLDEQAWFCGENFEYFQKLFEELKEMKKRTKVVMVLSEDCDLESISNIAKTEKLSLNRIFMSKSLIENNSLYEINL